MTLVFGFRSCLLVTYRFFWNAFLFILFIYDVKGAKEEKLYNKHYLSCKSFILFRKRYPKLLLVVMSTMRNKVQVFDVTFWRFILLRAFDLAAENTSGTFITAHHFMSSNNLKR